MYCLISSIYYISLDNMADNKKSILVYADWIDKFEELEDDEAGRLIKHFFRYVNDLNPEYPDRTTKLMFIDIKNTLKRDLGKWEEKSPQRSEKARVAGLASAEARKLKKQLDSTNELQVELNPTKSTVSVSVSDTVSESVNVSDSVNNHSSFTKALLKDEKWKKEICSFFKISLDELETKLGMFLTRLTVTKKNHPTLIEFAEHFNNWIPVNKSKNEPNSNNKSNPNNGYKPASVDREKLLRELAEDAANGNIPGDYSKVRTRSQA